MHSTCSSSVSRDAASYSSSAVAVRNAGPSDGARCGFYPSCSRYAAEALHEHGPLRGAALAAARLMRPQDPWRYPVCVAGDRRFLMDPVPEPKA